MGGNVRKSKASPLVNRTPVNAGLAHRALGRLCSVYLCLGFLFAGPVAADQRLVLTGSSTVAPLALEIGKRFERLNPGVRVDVQSGGSSRGVADARSGLADIGLVSRALKADESDLRATTIAIDGVGVIVHAKNPVSSLTDEQIRAVFTGTHTNWSMVGGAERPITVVNKAAGRSTLELFLEYFKLGSRDIRASVVIGDNQQGIKTVAGNPGAIGYVSIGAAEYEVTAGTPIRLLPMAGIEANVGNVSSGRFPLSRPLNLVTLGEPSALAQDFIRFARSKEAHDLVREQFFVPPAH